MANYNKVILAGNLTRDPQLSMMPSGTPVCELGIAVNRKYKNQQSGEMKEEVCFVDLRVFGKQAETLNQYTSKGKPLLVEGRLKFDQWEGKDGQKRSKHYVVVENFQFLGAPGGGQGGNRAPAAARAPAASASASEEMPPMEEAGAANGDIPF